MSVDPPAGSSPGWYPDPDRQHASRWWDGTGWTGAVSEEQAAQPYVAPVRPPGSGLALASLVVGIVSIPMVLTCLPLGPVAIGLGVPALRRRGGDRDRTYTWSFTGVTLGAVATVVWFAYLAFVVWALGTDA